MKLGSNDIGSVYLGTNAVQSVYLGSDLVWSADRYQQILSYATAQGYTLPSVGQQALQSQLLDDLITAGIWDKLDTFAVFATDGSSDFALIDWKRLTQYTAVNSPTFTTNSGFSGNGTSAYIDTNFNPSTSGVNYTLNNACRIMYGNFPADNGYPESASGTANNVTRNINSHSRQRINQGSLNLATGLSPSNWTGTNLLRTINRTSSTNVEMFANTTQSSGTQTSSVIDNNNQWILAGQTLFSSSSNVFKIYGMGASLVSENTDLYNALNTYITSL